MSGDSQEEKSLIYDSEERFNSYWHQIKEIRNLDPESILEVGIGTNFVSDYLKKYDFNLTTLDISRKIYNRHHPDIVGNIFYIPFKDASFEVVIACEVLEHQPFNKFKEGLEELYQVSASHVIISIPDVRFCLKLNFELIKFLELKKLITIPLNKFIFRSGLYNLIDGIEKPTLNSHYWEIGRKEYSLEKIKRVIEEQGFKIEKNYRIHGIKHHMFILKK